MSCLKKALCPDLVHPIKELANPQIVPPTHSFPWGSNGLQDGMALDLFPWSFFFGGGLPGFAVENEISILFISSF